ncbi:hypothetical protein ACS0TY_018159 [Phlomoides rotata]
MVRFQHNQDTAARKWTGRVCPNIRQILNKQLEASSSYKPIKAYNIHYQVIVNYGSQYTINLEEHTCSFRLWELSSIPCKHAISAISHQMGNAEDYVSDLYTVDTYKKSYPLTILGVNGEALWSNSIFIPQLGRPERERRHDVDEPSVKSKKSAKGRAPTALKRWQSTKGGSKGAGSRNRVVDESSALGTQEDATISAGSQSRHIRSLSIFRASNTQGYGSRSARSLGAVTKSAGSQKFTTRSVGSQPTPTKFLRTKTLARKKAAEVGGQLISEDQLMSPEQLRVKVSSAELELFSGAEGYRSTDEVPSEVHQSCYHL